MKSLKILLSILLLITGYMAHAQTYEYRLRAGFNIGGTAPIPLPSQIRKIKGYSPTMSMSLGADVIRHISDRWAIQTGLVFETKGMRTKAEVKGYQITMNISDGDIPGTVSGYYTGQVKTTVKNAYLTLPVTGVYKFSPRWRMHAGMFVSVLLDGDFNGSAMGGYIRDGSPIGEKIELSEANYNFSNDITSINWGAQLGGDWKAYRNFSVFADLSWAFNTIFKKDFDAISFEMYNIYMKIGFAYTF